jgi:ABC-type molybdate transport system ATPase subunit
METYRFLRSDVFCFDDSPELIIQVQDFELARSKPAVMSVFIENVVVPMRVVGMGNQKGMLSVRLAAEDELLFAHVRGARPDAEVCFALYGSKGPSSHCRQKK